MVAVAEYTDSAEASPPSPLVPVLPPAPRKKPMGALASYGDVATMIGQPGVSRAVGTAIGHNPVAFLIPCHRVIRQNGAIGGYMWGTKRKQAMIAWEGAQMEG